MRLPNFIVIGAQRSGTSLLHYLLGQHPHIRVSKKKETNFFAVLGEDIDERTREQIPMFRRSVYTMHDYAALFEGVTVVYAVGEISPVYLYCPHAAGRIARYLPDVKLVAVLRNPVDRALSAFTFNRNRGHEPHSDFFEAIHYQYVDMERHPDTWWGARKAVIPYIDGGFYHRQLQRYYRLFDHDQIRVILFEELTGDTETVMHELFRYLGVDANVPVETEVTINASRGERAKHITRRIPFKPLIRQIVPQRVRHALYNQLIELTQPPKPSFPPSLRVELQEQYHDEILRLQDLIDRDLSGWLIPEVVR